MKSLLLIVDDWEKLERFEDEWKNRLQITDAPFGSEGIRILKNHRFDFVIVDLIFGDHSAQELLNEVGIETLSLQAGGVFWLLADEELFSFKADSRLDFTRNVIIPKSLGWSEIQNQLKSYFVP